MKKPLSHEEKLQHADRIAYLIAGHIRGTITEKERDELDEWLVESDDNLTLFEDLTDEDTIEAAMQQYMRTEQEKAEALTGVKTTIGLRQRPLVQRLWPYFAAASLLLFAASLYFFFMNSTSSPTEKPIAQRLNKGDVKAGSDKAVLTLSDGRTIILDSTGTGLLARQGTVSIQQNKEGEVVYSGGGSAAGTNTISTPRGGNYQVVLSDGTKVWLNSESSLKFPAVMNGVGRHVELHGEAYFEVAKNDHSPFTVRIVTPAGDGGSVKVLGTHFNVNGYGDEGGVITTLLEGAVQVEKNGVTKRLSPGESAVASTDIKIAKTDVQEAVAWKEDKFLFRDASIRTVGEQIKRWYNVEVEYQGDIQNLFNAEASRSVPLTQLLDGLEGTGKVHFTLREKKLLVKP